MKGLEWIMIAFVCCSLFLIGNSKADKLNQTMTVNGTIAPPIISIGGYGLIPNFSFAIQNQYIVRSGESMWILLNATNEGYKSDEFIFRCYVPFNSTELGNISWTKFIMIGEQYVTTIQMPISLYLHEGVTYDIKCQIGQTNQLTQNITYFPLTISSQFYVQSLQRTAIIQVQDLRATAERQIENVPAWFINSILMLIPFLVRTRIDKIRDKRGKKVHPYMSFALLVIMAFFFVNIFVAILG